MAEIDKNSFGFLSQCVVSFMCFLSFLYEKEVSSARQFKKKAEKAAAAPAKPAAAKSSAENEEELTPNVRIILL